MNASRRWQIFMLFLSTVLSCLCITYPTLSDVQFIIDDAYHLRTQTEMKHHASLLRYELISIANAAKLAALSPDPQCEEDVCGIPEGAKDKTWEKRYRRMMTKTRTRIGNMTTLLDEADAEAGSWHV